MCGGRGDSPVPTGWGKGDEVGYHPTSSSFPKLELIGVNQCELGEWLITGTEAPPMAKLPNISIVGVEASIRHTRM